MVVLIIVGVLGTIAVGRTSALRDRLSVRAAATETVATFALARRWSVSRATRTAVAIDTAAASLIVRSYADTIAHRRLGSSHGVSSRRHGIQWRTRLTGLATARRISRIIIRRGSAADTISVSRLGRVRR